MPSMICNRCEQDIRPSDDHKAWVDLAGELTGVDGHAHLPRARGWQEVFEGILAEAHDAARAARALAESLDLGEKVRSTLAAAARGIEELANILESTKRANWALLRENALIDQMRLDAVLELADLRGRFLADGERSET